MAVKTKVLTRRVVDQQALYEGIGERMKKAREKAGLTQQEVGIVLGMSRANVANLEAGQTRILLDHVYNLALLLDVPARELLP